MWFKLGAHSFPLNMIASTKYKLREVLLVAQQFGGVNQHCVGKKIWANSIILGSSMAVEE